MVAVISVMLDFLSTEGFQPHGMCLLWRPDVFWAHLVSDFLIAISYFSIPVTLVWLARRRHFAYGWLLYLFSAFIVACGFTHVLRIWTMFVPDYGVEAVAKVITAAVSLVTAVALWPLIPKMLAAMRDSVLAQSAQREAVAKRHSRDLEAANARLMASHAEMEGILYAVTHDLKSPIVTVRGFAGALAEAVDERGDQGIRHAATRILTATEKLGSITDSLFEFGRYARAEVEPTVLNLSQVINSVRAMLDVEITQAGALIVVKEPLAALTADASQMLRLLLNLVGNALKYGCPHPGMTIEISTELRGTETIVTVRDQGPGVPEELRKDVFRLFRSHGPRHENSAGLGLAIVEKIAAKHGGRCWIEEAAGGGAAFRVCFPEQATAFNEERIRA